MSCVEETLRLLKGMQDIHLTAADVTVNETGVIIVGLTQWTPPTVELVKSTSVYEGRGDGP